MKTKRLITILIVLIIFSSFILVDWDKNSIHNNGISAITKMGKAALTPDLSVVDKALLAGIKTLVYASVGISIALVIGFILSILGANILFENKQISRFINNILAAMRSIHELVWALFFVASIGLSPFSAIFAIAIPYGGMLGKVFIDIFNSVSVKKIKALEELGASSLQILLYGYLPEAYNDLVSYSLYRFECAIRSSTILSFVGLGGLGFQIQITLGDLKYNEMFTYIYTLILLVLILDIWGNKYREKNINRKISIYIFFALMIFSWLYVSIVDKALITSIFNQRNAHFSLEFLKKLAGIGNNNPAYFNINEIKTVLLLMVETLQMSIISITIASVLMILTVVGATKDYSKKIIFIILRGSYLISRAVPELIWAMLLIFVIKPGIIVGALALALHNFGILSKLCAEVIEELDKGPLLSLKKSGATRSQILIYGVIPMSFKRFISYIVYRWEVILRTTIVVGFVGAGGLGYYFKLGMSLFHYTKVSLVIICYLILVKIADKTAVYLNKIYSK